MKRTHVIWLSLLSGMMVLSNDALNAQTTDDWLAWQGCWQADGAPSGEYLCVVPDGATGVRMVTVARGAVVAESRVITDGRARRVQTDGCTGSEVAFWSADYNRVFLSSELSCETGVKRRASGVFTIASIDSWMSVQAVTIDGRTATRTVNYTAVNDDVAPAAIRPALRRAVVDRMSARNAALSAVDANDVDEAVERIDPAAVQEWLKATRQPFQLADELAGAASDVVTRSALDHTGYYPQDRRQQGVVVVERPVIVERVVERPVYVNTHTHAYRYRTCWDPFFSGVVIGLGRVSVGVGHSHCGRSYVTYYSPWGYDLHGWHYVHSRPIIVAGRPVIHYHEPYRPRTVYVAPRSSGDRYDRYDDTRKPTQPRENIPVRTAQPREYSTTSRGTVTPGGYTQPRTTTNRSTTTITRESPPTVNPPVRTETRRTYEPTPTTRRTYEPPQRESTTTRTAQPRTAQPRTTTPTTTPTRQPASPPEVFSARPPKAPTTTSSSETRAPERLPVRTAKPRTGGDGGS